MEYYKTPNGDLMQFNKEKNTCELRNTVEDERIFLTGFDLKKCTQIKYKEFCRLMNVYFKDVQHEWKYNHSYFKKLPNFESKELEQLSINVPQHDIHYKHSNYFLVYHLGRVYYHTGNINGYNTGQLLNFKTLEFVKWTALKNCAPIINTNTKKVC